MTQGHSRTLGFGALGGAVAAIVVAAALGGDFTATALGVVLAAVLAGITGYYAWESRLSREQHARIWRDDLADGQAERNAELERAQRDRARLISTWAVAGSDDPADDEVWAVAHNGSAEPVYDCRLELLDWTWAESSVPTVLNDRIFYLLIPKSETDPTPFGPLSEPPEHGSSHPPLRITYTDGSGMRWRRWPNGQLEQLS